MRRRFLTFLGTGSAARSTGGKTGGKPTSFQPIEFSGTDNPVRPEGFYNHPKGRTKKTKGPIAQEKAGRLARVKSILAASTRQDWEADGPRLWVNKGDTALRIVDLTDDDGRIELDEEWARSGGAVGLRVDLSICDGPDLLAKVPAACVDSGRAFIPWPREDEDGRLVVARWQYDLCRVISPGEYLGAYPVRSYLRRAGIFVI